LPPPVDLAGVDGGQVHASWTEIHIGQSTIGSQGCFYPSLRQSPTGANRTLEAAINASKWNRSINQINHARQNAIDRSAAFGYKARDFQRFWPGVTAVVPLESLDP
jgi:hypothetical protein